MPLARRKANLALRCSINEWVSSINVSRRGLTRGQKLASLMNFHSELFEAGDLLALGGRAERVALQVDVEEWREPLFLVLLRHLQQGSQIADLVVFQKQIIESRQAVERAEVRNGVLAKGQGEQALELVDALDGLDAVVVKIERGQLRQAECRRNVGDLVLA